MHEESIRSLQPHFGQHVIRHIIRIRRREVPNHIEYKLGLFESRARLRQSLGKGNLKFFAGCFLPQGKVTVVLLGDPVFACAEFCAVGHEFVRDFERALGKGRGAPALKAKAVTTTPQTANRFI